MKKMYLLILSLSLLSGCSLINSIEVDEYKTYLDNKYGIDEGFYLVDEGTCNWFELGRCIYFFSSNELNGETFQISGSFKGKEKVFKDWYIEEKYKKQLNKYYDDLFKEKFKFNYEIITSVDYENIDDNISFEEYLKSENIEISISLRTSDSNIDINSLSSIVNTMIANNKLKNVYNVGIQIDNCYDGNYSSDCNKYYKLYSK